MRNFTLRILSVFFLCAFLVNANAQCPNAQGMTATPLTNSGNCFLFVQFAIPNSNVSIYNASGYVAQGTATAMGSAIIQYTCSAGPITGVLSLSGTQTCNTVTISQPATLPVKFSSFTGEIVTGGVLLKWNIEYEINNQKYQVEKSMDGRNYQSIGEIAVASNSLVSKSYSFKDAAFGTGDVAYYRIRQVDIDGKSTYTSVAYVNDRKSGLQPVKLFPNPFHSGDAIQITGVKSSDLNGNVHVYNSTGTEVRYELSGSNAIRLDPSAPSGLYIVKVLDASFRILKN